MSNDNGNAMSVVSNRGERLLVMLSGEELAAVDDFRFRKRMPSRAAAVRELLKRGLTAAGFKAAPHGTKSEEFGVLGKTPKPSTGA